MCVTTVVNNKLLTEARRRSHSQEKNSNTKHVSQGHEPEEGTVSEQTPEHAEQAITVGNKLFTWRWIHRGQSLQKKTVTHHLETNH